MSMTVSNLTSQTDRLIYAMQLLGDRTRFKIFKLLINEPDLCVSEIASKLGVTPSAVSQHFRSLEIIGIVDKQRQGQKICYGLRSNDQFVARLKAFINQETNQGGNHG